MKRSKLKNLFNKNKNQENWCKYKTQRNYCVNLLCKTKNNIIIIYISKKSQTIKNSGKASNLTLAKMTQIQKESCCYKIIRSKQMKKKLQQL